ncbi:MAG: 2-amino-4-hydroxy-6-hydroxymethyldihydropteridine diphosphokinase [Bifidobacteriaceae bacterium]|jgi:dihydroneopterin aldolase/2-amino-4-hydroxy-6-hydroxymethyldihydropteridine diphosphokinase|nr:2-amino-4-hydroxy-6-hydroxymethyldihydropteridine diphosphokinase [Bifidobacteriaceae bacterium]MCI1978698.1 2-amino-4-hydroxy-6-hydroxymethyldihydropteridine diphosphokinase [Bifidobacteriaceae bacterium]
MDSITLRGVSAQGTHGVLDFEHTQPQTFSVDATLFVDLSKAGASDDLADTVDYGQIAARIVRAIEGEHLDLIEALAARIADSILQTSAIRRVRVTVHKPEAPIKVPFSDVEVSIERSRVTEENTEGPELPQAPTTHRVIVAMGGNLNDPATAMRSAVVAMDGIPGNQIMGISPLYRTTPWGMEEGTPDFLNAVVELSTTMEPMDLLKALQMIEAAHGRSREVHWGSRPLDLDIIDFDGAVTNNPVLTLPHPRAWQRAFVLAPMLDLDPNAVLPGEHGGKVASLLEGCPDKDAVERISDDWILGNTGVSDETAGERS